MILILSAMPEELEAVSQAIDAPRSIRSAGREVTSGSISGHAVTAAFSRWGKVAAASTAAHLLTAFQPSRVIFTGIAGALRDDLAIGDHVFARALFQHDLDASPFFPRTHVPLLDLAALPTDPALTEQLAGALRAATAAGAAWGPGTGARSPTPRVWVGDVATGDQVIGTRAARARVLEAVPSALCVEMEGAAVAQVCHEFGVPFACLRMISDRADETLAPAAVFELARRSGVAAAAMLRHWLGSTPAQPATQAPPIH